MASKNKGLKKVVSKTAKKAAKKTGKPRAPRAPAKPWEVDIEVNLEKYSAKGSTPIDALNAALEKVPKGMYKTSTLVRLSSNHTTALQIFYSLQVRRMLLSHTVREIWAKRLESMQKKIS